MENKKKARVRFAPSPTGELHIGSLRIALIDYLMAKKFDGSFVLRVEDTDRDRLVEGAIERLVETMDWSGIKNNEGVLLDEHGKVGQYGELGPYIQSERLGIYDKYAEKLLKEERAYRCFCSSERLQDMRKAQQEKKEPPKYDRHCLGLSKEEVDEKIAKGEKYVLRFKIPKGKTFFDDLVFGRIEVENETLDDQVIVKSDGFPTYHLAVVVDDHLMKISHIVRSTEWIASTPKHVLLYEALGWKEDMPFFCHVPNILNKDKKKLSKREGSVSVEDFRLKGYPQEAIINFIALLGWNPKTEQEIFTLEELIDQFDIEKINKAGAVFDIKRLDWISSQHIKKMDINELYERSLPFLKKKAFYKSWNMKHETPKISASGQAWSNKQKKEYVKKVLKVEKDRLEKFNQVGESNQFFFTDDIDIDADSMRWKDSSDDDTKLNLEKAQDVLSRITEENWNLEKIEKELLEAAGDKRGDLLFPLRAALTGQDRSPSPFEVAWVLGKEKTMERIISAIDYL
jgi:nondiscriminating glutamyl-tRNA synthetase